MATLGCILPACILVTVLAKLYLRYRNLSVLQSVLHSLRPAVVALIAAAGVSILLTAFWGTGAAVTLDGRSGLLGSHIDFGDVRRGWNFRSLGHGDVNFEEIIRVLNDMGYDCPLSVEWEDSGMDRIDGATEAAAFVRKVDFKKSDIKFDDAISNG